MKRSLRTLAIALLACAPFSRADAQRLTFVGGLTFSKLRGLNDVRGENRSGTIFGVSLNVPAGAAWSIQPEALVISKGGKFAPEDASTGEREVRLDYIEVPVLVRRNLLNSTVLVPHVYAGPTVGFNVNCSVTATTGALPTGRSDCERNNFRPNSLEWGATLGAGVDLSAGKYGVTVGARYGVGLSNVVDESETTIRERVRNGTFAVYAGVRF